MMKFILAATAMLAFTAQASAADKVVLMLNWYVYGEHAPFYYGKAKGIFAAENIDLEIQEGRGSAATTQAVAAKTADFGYVLETGEIVHSGAAADLMHDRRVTASYLGGP